MAFLDKNGLQTLTNRLVQGEAIKVASHRGHTVKNVIDNITRECENVATPNTMTLENRVSEFKVGNSRDVDVSGDVEEGKVEVELKGKTWQNLLGTLKGTPSGINATNTVIDNGDKTVTITRSVEPVNTHVGVYFDLNKSCLKENQTYTIIINVIENTLPNGMYLVDSNYTGFTPSKTISSNQTGIIRYSVTYTGTGASRWWIWTLRDTKFGKVTFSYPILLEGDHTQTPVEELPKYLEGIKSSFEDGIVDVEVQGKNLFDNNNIYEASYTSWVPRIDMNIAEKIETDSYEATNIKRGIATVTKVIPSSIYSLSISELQNDARMGIAFYEKLEHINKPDTHCIGKFSNISSKKYTFKTPKKECYAVVGLFGDYTPLQSSNVILNNFKTMQLENISSATSYEPYYKKKISFNIGEPLRSLPNGICDEIRNNNGQWELVRRVGKLVFDGTENWVSSGTQPDDTNFKRFDLTLRDTLKNGNYVRLLCNNLPHIYIHSLPTGSRSITQECISHHSIDIDTTNVVLKTSTIGGDSVANFKQYLSNNPLVVYYELQSPIITPIEPIEFEVKPLATMTINSEIAPTSNHKVVLNRVGQIEQGIIQIAELKSRVDALETAYDSYLLETQHKLSILGFEYELESEEV